MAGKELINESRILEAARAGRNSITVSDKAIITPLARDAASKHKIRIERGPTPSSQSPILPSALKIVAIGSDHGGFEFKAILREHVEMSGFKIVDVGTDSPRSCDYPEFAYAVSRMVSDGRAGFGIMIDGAGIGSSMVCNKVPGIRAACAYNEFTAWNARAHNNANVLTLGSRTLGIEVCKRITDVFLATAYEGGRHELRLAKLMDIEHKFLR